MTSPTSSSPLHSSRASTTMTRLTESVRVAFEVSQDVLDRGPRRSFSNLSLIIFSVMVGSGSMALLTCAAMYELGSDCSEIKLVCPRSPSPLLKRENFMIAKLSKLMQTCQRVVG